MDLQNEDHFLKDFSMQWVVEKVKIYILIV